MIIYDEKIFKLVQKPDWTHLKSSSVSLLYGQPGQIRFICTSIEV